MSNIMRLMRERFGQPQQWWADYLSLSLAQVKMAESGKRNLPTTALLKLGQLEVLFHSEIKAKETTHNGGVSNTEAKPAGQLNYQSKKMAHLAMLAQRKLEAIQKQYEQASNSIAIANILLLQPPNSQEGTKDKIALELLQIVAKKQLQECGPAAQTYLQWKIDCYTYGATRAEELFKKL